MSKSAFRIVPVHPNDHELLSFSWDGQFYYDKCLAFCARSSCRIFEQTSSALEWIAITKLGCKAIVHVLDDFLFLDQTYEGCLQIAWLFLPYPYCGDKPTTFHDDLCWIFLGFFADRVSLPSDKLSKAKDLFSNFSTGTHAD